MNDESHRLDCLARYICRLPTRERRREFLARVELWQGREVAADLEQRVKQQWGKLHE